MDEQRDASNMDDDGAGQVVVDKGSMTAAAMDDGGAGCSRMATEQSGGGTGCSWKLSSEALSLSPWRPDGDCCAPSIEIRLARLSAMAAQANAQSSSRSSTSPTHVCSNQQRRAGSTPSPRVLQSGQRSKKRKSPYVTMPLFRSPLSRMLLSPRMQLPRTPIRSPLVRHGTTNHDFDLNMALEDCEENAETGSHANENGESDSNPNGNPHAQQNARRIVISNEKRRAIFEALLARAKNGEMKGHETTEVSIEFSVPLRTVQRIWKKGKSFLDQGLLDDVNSAKSKCGRKKIQLDVSTLRDLPLSSRTTIADVATHFGVSKAKVHSMKREGIIKRVSNTIKPYLTERNKKDRLKWCLSMIDPMSIPHDPIFKGLFDHVFIDEKWYCITRKIERYYSVPGEVEPTRTCKNKNYIPKIQILTAVARPRFDSNGNCTFDGKIGCFAFVTYEPAKRSSVNRPAGTIEMKPIESITKDVMRSFMIEKVLPAIRAKWPREDANKPIYIQQDNAKPHVAPNDRLFCEAAKEDGFDIRLVCQPANSPDLNILDLGFFNSIQSLQYKKSAKTTEDLLAAIGQAFAEYSVGQSNRIFLTLHGCMKEVMKIGGGNGYDVPHIRKGMLERQGCLPLQLKCDASLVQDVIAQTSN